MQITNLEVLTRNNAASSRGTSWRWGVVKTVSPLGVRLDGETQNIYPSDCLERVTVGQRVYVRMCGVRAVVMGGVPSTPWTVAGASITGGTVAGARIIQNDNYRSLNISNAVIDVDANIPDLKSDASVKLFGYKENDGYASAGVFLYRDGAWKGSLRIFTNNNYNIISLVGAYSGSNVARVDITDKPSITMKSTGNGTGSIEINQNGYINFVSSAGYTFFPRSEDKTSFKVRNMPWASTGFNVVMNSVADGLYSYVSSTRKTKYAIEDLRVDPYRILDLQPRSWIDKRQWELYQNYLADSATESPTGKWDEFTICPSRVPGLIAEELQDTGLDIFNQYMSGELAGIQYDRLWILLIPIVRDLLNQVDQLKTQLEELK